MADVSGSVFICRGAHRDKDQFAMLDGIAGLGAEQQASSLDVLLQRRAQAGFANGRDGLLQLTDLARVYVDA
ncbi:hypothetical protein D3C85_271770 [compost metagenome]